jgi:hypothetical protein
MIYEKISKVIIYNIREERNRITYYTEMSKDLKSNIIPPSTTLK